MRHIATINEKQELKLLPDSHLSKHKLTLERFTLTFASPNTKDKGNL